MVYTKRVVCWHDGHGNTIEFREGDSVAICMGDGGLLTGNIVDITNLGFEIEYEDGKDFDAVWIHCEDIDEIRIAE